MAGIGSVDIHGLGPCHQGLTVGRRASDRRLSFVCMVNFAAALFFAAILAPSASAASFVPETHQLAVQSYEKEFGVGQQAAEANLAVQERGVGIVGELKDKLGAQYAGVWFDNSRGEFVVPTLAGVSSAAVNADLANDGFGRSSRTAAANSSWAHLLAAQEEANEALAGPIKARLAKTALDPQANAVAIILAEEIALPDLEEVQDLVASLDVKVVVRREDVRRFDMQTTTCIASEYVCGKPLRGGIAMYPGGLGVSGPICTSGFKALGNGNGARFMLTAGHCVNGIGQWKTYDNKNEPHYMGAVEQAKFPGGDWAKINSTGTWWDVSPWTSMVAYWGVTQERAITAESWSYPGEQVCHSGIATGGSCGTVSQVNVTETYGGGETVNHLTQFAACAYSGDSGGPVFAGNTALGIVSAGNLEQPECARTISYVEITEATSAMGVSVGPRVGNAPYVVTNPVSGIQELEATFNGTVNPEGSSTSYVFQYGTTTAYGSSTASVGLGAGAQPISVSATVPNLHAGTTYHYRVVAFNALGTTYGADQQFTTSSAPAAVNTGSAINVYLRAADGSLYQKACCFGSEGWTNWWHMGSPYSEGITSGPAAVMQSSVLNVYARGSEGERSLYQISCCFGSEGWTNWWHMGSPYGGGVSTSPAAVMQYSTLNVYAGGGNDHLYQIACCFGSEGWTSWWDMGSPPGGGITSSPAAVNAGGGVINVYARGANGHLYQKACCFGSEGWTSWWDMGSPPGGGVTSGPAAVNTGSAINVYARGANGHLYQKACCFGSEGWTSWWDMGSP